MRAFDRKFGADLLAKLPTSPAVYLFKDDAGEVLYVGKAKNIRRRLRSYRNASRRKAHRKMRRLVREANTLEVQLQPNEETALLVENEFIRTLRPPFNIDGAYTFLYPAIGVGYAGRTTLLCFTTDVDAFAALALTWFGSFRSRVRTKEAFDGLVALLALLGHVEKRSALPEHPRIRGSRVMGLRQLPADFAGALEPLLAGESMDALKRIARLLLDKPRARRDAEQVQSWLMLVSDFYQSDIVALREALSTCGREPGFVRQQERDALFIRARSTGQDV
jgi:predicted GIY-YIG superfamily endonuclease